jgi:cell division protein FtsB
MANASAPTAPGSPGNLGSPVPRCSPVATRRRVLVLAVILVVLGIAVMANYGPVHAYRDARSRFETATAEVEALKEKKAELQSQLGKLTEAEYLESLARQELTYARPGESVYIITVPAEEAVSATSATSSAAGSVEGATSESTDTPGPLERLLSAFLGLF